MSVLGIATRSPAMARVLSRLEGLARTDLGIVFFGESGTGKEHLAAALHRASARVAGPFVAVRCASVSAEPLEGQLFGPRRGAIGGARGERKGALAAADGGTLLLNEIGEAELEVQLALVRALETRRVRPIGADADRPVDVRVFAATTRDLSALVESGAFRKDLHQRLAALTVRVPALRDRPEDLPLLAETLLEDLGSRACLSPAALDLFTAYPFPGNVRELKSALRRALELAPEARELEPGLFAEFRPTRRPPPRAGSDGE